MGSARRRRTGLWKWAVWEYKTKGKGQQGFKTNCNGDLNIKIFVILETALRVRFQDRIKKTLGVSSASRSA